MKLMNMTKLVGLSAIALMMTGCGGGSSGSSTPPVGSGGDTTINYSGDYDITITATTAYGDNGECRDGRGEFVITEQYDIQGYVVSDWGDYWDLTGDITQSGSVNGGLADAGGGLVADFNGQLTATGGNGDWRDAYNCAGTWYADRL